MNSTLDGIAAVQDRPPRSATPLRAGLLGITAGLFALWITRDHPTFDAATRAVIASLAIIGTIALHEIFISRVYLRPSAGLSRQAVRPLGIARVATRLGALTSIYAGIGVIYWLLPEYHGAFYLPFWSLLRSLAPYVIVAAPFYFAWMDRHQRETDDAYLLWGRFLFRREQPASWKPVREMLAGWGVKAFFLPLMTVYLSKDADHLTASLAHAMHAPATIATFVFMYDLSFTMDLMFGTVGYLCTFRILDSHVRTAEPTTLGWVAALMCYQPFWSLFSNNYIRYEGSMFWDNWLMSAPTLRVIWGTVIILLLLTYALCTISFGLRFSNLTNRGIITSGPYRFTKHPAYITKNLSYWMVSVPFVEPLGWQIGLMHCAGLVAVNLIYYVRAKTEERHLMRDPDYRAYAEWIEQHGLFARIRQAFGQRAPA
ncbi:isoprenylcysteine carboxylmethyltransferase family protein [Burkholderia lata]|uniref:Membrane protein n=1 Tax=Burkholderia lata (strain ATCC 17760 / DSM 23089 / LMG 22485 / NCIMB 9086 / R18194 / 383) TaxID=482957 RepID=A0A6P2SZ12_BURL3|nr:isoprenylcysteine carboxylmethyltransferase family protein [Burkholderia lata]VWC53570.1 membrane protein [Burkholderia lata]